MQTAALFWPAFVVAMATTALYVATFIARRRLVVAGKASIKDYRTYENEVPESRLWANAIANQFETPVLFYVACLFATVLWFVDGVSIALAWAYALTKCAHMATHVIGNRLKYRMPVFGLSLLFLAALWLYLALKVL